MKLFNLSESESTVSPMRFFSLAYLGWLMIVMVGKAMAKSIIAVGIAFDRSLKRYPYLGLIICFGIEVLIFIMAKFDLHQW